MHPKKSLGQNFLKSKSAIRAMLSAGEISPTDIVLEVGPGKGILTEALLEVAKKVFAVEKDESLVELLREKFSAEISTGKLELISADILEFEPQSYKLEAQNYKLIANIPYYITGQFLRKFLSGTCKPQSMVVMLQKEVAKRIVARDGKESILSISVKAYGDVSYVETVPAKYFSPEPKVDSAILAIKNISSSFFKDIDEKKFFEILKAGFAHKRKFVVRNLETYTNPRKIAEIFEKNGLNRSLRPENLTLENWKQITISLSC